MSTTKRLLGERSDRPVAAENIKLDDERAVKRLLATRPAYNEGPPIEELAAAAMEIDWSSSDEVQHLLSTRQAYSNDPWNWFDKLPEVHYPANFVGYCLSQVSYFVAKMTDRRTQTFEPVLDNDVELAVDFLEGDTGDIQEFSRRYGINRSIAAEAFLYGYDEDGVTKWEVLSPAELVVSADGAYRKIAPGASIDGNHKLRSNDYLKRLWKPHAKFVLLADSPMKALDTTCEELYLLTESVKARVKSRLASNGILFLPNSISLPAAFGGQNGTQNGTPGPVDPLINTLITLWTTAIINPGVAAGALPTLLRGPDDAGEKIKHITMDPSIVEVEIKLRAELVQRIARGLDLPPEIVLGMSDANHWSSWSIMDSAFRNHIAPICAEWCKALTKVWLRPFLVTSGMSPEDAMQYHIWYDSSSLLSSQNEAQDTREFVTMGVVSEEYARERTGIPESAAPSEEEKVRLIGMKAGDAYLATFGMKIADKIDWEKVGSSKQQTGPTPSGQDPFPKVGPTRQGNPGAPGAIDSNAKQASIRHEDVDALVAWMEGRWDLWASRAGARLRNSLTGDVAERIKGVPNGDVLNLVSKSDVEASGIAWDSLFSEVPGEISLRPQVLDSEQSAKTLTQIVLALMTSHGRPGLQEALAFSVGRTLGVL